MQTLAVIALIVGLLMFFRWLGPPARKRPEETSSIPQSPEADIPPTTTPIL